MTLYEHYQPANLNLGTSFYGANILVAQSFTVGTVGPNEIHNIMQVKFKGKRNVGNAGTCYVDIKAADGAGKPTGPVLSRGQFEAMSEGTSTHLLNIFMSSYILRRNTKYNIVWSAPTGSAANNFQLSGYSTNGPDPYSGGEGWRSTDGGATWAKISAFTNFQDLYFEVWGNQPIWIMKPGQMHF